MFDDFVRTISQYRGILTLILAIALPRLLPRLLALFIRARHPSTSQIHRGPPLTQSLKYVLAIHAVFQASQIFNPPYDIFKFNRLPLLVPNDVLRSAVLRRLPGATSTDLNLLGETHPLLELLLQKLSRLDGRYLYSRYGHQAMINCVWCTDSGDYLVFSLPSILSRYVLGAVLLGLMSLVSVGGVEASRRAKAWRGWMGWALAGGAVGECAARYLWELRPTKGECTHVSSLVSPLSRTTGNISCFPRLHIKTIDQSKIKLTRPIALVKHPHPPSPVHPPPSDHLHLRPRLSTRSIPSITHPGTFKRPKYPPACLAHSDVDIAGPTPTSSPGISSLRSSAE